MFRTLFSLAVLITLFTIASAQTCTVQTRTNAFRQFRKSLRDQMGTTPSLIPIFIRAAFHDCITATSTKTGSGCNGSLQFEIITDALNNARMAPFLTAIQTAKQFAKNGQCVSVADGIQIGAEVALRIVKGPKMKNIGLYDPALPRTDATASDDAGQLPSFFGSFSSLASFYSLKGFSEKDLVVSSVGGHAIGKFVFPSDRSNPFTPNSDFTKSYAENLIIRQETNSTTNQPGFNTLPSDSNLLNDPTGVAFLKLYSNFKGLDASGIPKFGKSTKLLKDDFADFMLRLSRLTDQTVGDPTKLSQPRK